MDVVVAQLVLKISNLLQALMALRDLDKAVAPVADNAFIGAAIEDGKAAQGGEGPLGTGEEIFLGVGGGGEGKGGEVEAVGGWGWATARTALSAPSR